ncbi:hypothetical protein OUZ56_012597 [Daphnia magna]|uniref:Cc8L18.2-like protein n=1 Tax=Daphnia magna TaxID=35525 RepID=A0ABQ9Z3H1_9CRUS|nr:hypothetical protein OUZ56_012597 [Daphnia magna]
MRKSMSPSKRKQKPSKSQKNTKAVNSNQQRNLLVEEDTLIKIRWLQTHLAIPQNRGTITQYMSDTFAARQAMIESELTTFTLIVEKFPSFVDFNKGALVPYLDIYSSTKIKIFINNNIYHPSTSPENDLEWEAGILLRLRHQFFLPYEALILVSDAIHDNYNRSVLTIQEKLSTLVSTEVFGSTAFKAAFDKIHHQEQLTRYRLETTWDKFFPTVMPKEVILNRAEPSYNWINDPQLGKIMDEVFEIGFRQSFKKNTAANDNQQQDVSYSDVWDGKYLKCHPLFIRHNGHILCIQVYMDEVETGNPLGSKKGKHKVAGSAGKAITPKLHTLLHFPSQIRLFGPPRYSWCFRYESKNARFKKIMRRNCNFRNVPWSFCAHHQKLVGLDVRENGEGDFFGKMERFTIHGHHSPIHVKYAWWAKSDVEAFKELLLKEMLADMTVRILGGNEKTNLEDISVLKYDEDIDTEVDVHMNDTFGQIERSILVKLRNTEIRKSHVTRIDEFLENSRNRKRKTAADVSDEDISLSSTDDPEQSTDFVYSSSDANAQYLSTNKIKKRYMKKNVTVKKKCVRIAKRPESEYSRNCDSLSLEPKGLSVMTADEKHEEHPSFIDTIFDICGSSSIMHKGLAVSVCESQEKHPSFIDTTPDCTFLAVTLPKKRMESWEINEQLAAAITAGQLTLHANAFFRITVKEKVGKAIQNLTHNTKTKLVRKLKRDNVKAAAAADASRGGAGAMAMPSGRLPRFPAAQELTTADKDAATYADEQLQLTTEFQARRAYIHEDFLMMPKMCSISALIFQANFDELVENLRIYLLNKGKGFDKSEKGTLDVLLEVNEMCSSKQGVKSSSAPVFKYEKFGKPLSVNYASVNTSALVIFKSKDAAPYSMLIVCGDVINFKNVPINNMSQAVLNLISVYYVIDRHYPAMFGILLLVERYCLCAVGAATKGGQNNFDVEEFAKFREERLSQPFLLFWENGDLTVVIVDNLKHKLNDIAGNYSSVVSYSIWDSKYRSSNLTPPTSFISYRIVANTNEDKESRE